jgi:hypothetical protein
MLRKLLLTAALCTIAAAPALGRPTADQAQYAPYRFLIGEWNVSSEKGGPPVGVFRFRWGPNQTYIWYAMSLLVNGKEEPHFEGMLMWNGVHKNLDMLVALDLQYGLSEETGSVSVQADGTVVRETTATYSEGTQPMGSPVVGADGATGHFRQTFKAVADDKILTRVLHKTKDGWTATFPGSDHLVMTRRVNG